MIYINKKTIEIINFNGFCEPVETEFELFITRFKKIHIY